MIKDQMSLIVGSRLQKSRHELPKDALQLHPEGTPGITLAFVLHVNALHRGLPTALHHTEKCLQSNSDDCCDMHNLEHKNKEDPVPDFAVKTNPQKRLPRFDNIKEFPYSIIKNSFPYS